MTESQGSSPGLACSALSTGLLQSFLHTAIVCILHIGDAQGLFRHTAISLPTSSITVPYGPILQRAEAILMILPPSVTLMTSGDFNHTHGASPSQTPQCVLQHEWAVTKTHSAITSVSTSVSPILTACLFCQTSVCDWSPKCLMHLPHSHRRGRTKIQPCCP